MEAEVRQELEATVAARKELGEHHDDELIAGFLERIEHRVAEAREKFPPPELVRQPSVTPMALGSIGAGVGATAIATGNGDPWLAAVAWLAIAVVNLGYAFRRR